jgi:uncharacterized protein
MVKIHIIALVLVSLILASYSGAAAVGTSSIMAPAVIISNNTGSLTEITLTITNGTGKVSITGPQNVGTSTLQSAYTAAMYASSYTNHTFGNYNFTYGILGAGENVSGPSAGAAMAMLAVSAFENKPLRTDFTMTGTISSDGSIGEIGGVYDKVGAAKGSGLDLILVPKVPQGNSEGELYLLVQTNFGIPLVQVANISQAAYFALNSSVSGKPNETTYNFYTDYNVGSLPNATINCTASCNYTIFNKLLNATFNLTRNEIDSLDSNPKFADVGAQFGKVLNQSVMISKHGYIYTAADFAFLNYVNVFYFNGYPSNRTSALALLYNIQDLCSSLTPPPLTSKNYNYVISAELRQLWGNYTIGQAISFYNTTEIESDQILDELYLGAQANGWCTAAKLVYSESNQNGTYLVPSDSLRSIAYSRIGRALPYGNSLYLQTAQQAYSEGNWPLAILDADYAYALANAASNSSSMTAEQLNNVSLAMASNSTFGVWATEFSKEVQFYVSESRMAQNATLAKSYAQSAYSAALLAQQLSNDTSTISQNLVAGQQQFQSTSTQKLINDITADQKLISVLLLIIILLIIINTILIVIIMNRVKPERKTASRKTRRK